MQKSQNEYLNQVWKNTKIAKCLSQLGMEKFAKCLSQLCMENVKNAKCLSQLGMEKT